MSAKLTNDGKNQQKKLKLNPELLKIPFDNISGWIAAYKQFPAEQVEAAVIRAFRKRFFISLEDAAEKVGVSPQTWSRWENGASKIRWKNKRELVMYNWFLPQHFGTDAASIDINSKMEAVA